MTKVNIVNQCCSDIRRFNFDFFWMLHSFIVSEPDGEGMYQIIWLSSEDLLLPIPEVILVFKWPGETPLHKLGIFVWIIVVWMSTNNQCWPFHGFSQILNIFERADEGSVICHQIQKRTFEYQLARYSNQNDKARPLDKLEKTKLHLDETALLARSNVAVQCMWYKIDYALTKYVSTYTHIKYLWYTLHNCTLVNWMIHVSIVTSWKCHHTMNVTAINCHHTINVIIL